MTAYLDHAATTPLHPAVLEAMTPYLTEHFGNASGSHSIARRARQAVEEARDEVAAALGCQAREVVFTSGGTEADNLAVLGAATRPACSAIEHHAVLHAVEHAGGTVVGVRADGAVDLDALRDIRADVVSVMLANNEVGVRQDLEAVRAAIGDDVVLHTDAVHAFPWVDVPTAAAPADLIAISGHKFGGPKGVGALVVREGTRLDARSYGGGQERERRSGTHNVAGIVGLARAASIATAGRAAAVERVTVLRDRLVDGLIAAVPGVRETVSRDRKVAGNAHVLIDGVESESLLVLLDEAGVCASAGSACASGAIEPSHVLLAMGLDAVEAGTALRLTLGPTTSDDEIDFALKAVPDVIRRLRGA